STFATAVSTPVIFGAFTGTTTSFTSLSPATTYYVRVRAENGDLISTAFSLTGSTVTLPTPPPNSLSGAAQGVSSITWTWSSVTGASSYNLYQATSSALVQSAIVGLSVTEVGLATNTAYGRRVTAIVSGVETALSISATAYT